MESREQNSRESSELLGGYSKETAPGAAAEQERRDLAASPGIQRAPQGPARS